VKIFQIFYNEETFKNLDNAFIPYDNSASSFPDWYEYSAIREIFNRNSFGRTEYIGVLSPRFFEKTGLTGSEIIKIVESSKSDVISFSSRFDQIAYYKNPFFQGEFYHPGLFELSRQVFREIRLDVDLQTLVSDQSRTIFSHYFIAKRHVWQKYIAVAEKLFALSQGQSELARALNAPLFHRAENHYTYKVFLIERLIAGVLEQLDLNASVCIDYRRFLRTFGALEPIFNDLLALEAFKSAFLKTRRPEYLNLFEFHRNRIPLNKILHG